MTAISPADLKEAANQLPPSPQIFGKLGKMLRDTNTDLGDITELVNSDASLTTQVLRLSNSVMFNQGDPIDNLDDAINRIGFRELFKLVGMAAASSVFTKRNNTYNLEGSLMWENSLCCAMAMEFLARKLGLDEQDAYTLGLLRSMGKMVIDLCAKGDPEFPRYPNGEGLPLLEWEEYNFGTTNPDVTRFLLSSWNFAPETAASIQYQYEPEKAASPSTITVLLNLAGATADELGKTLPGEKTYWEQADARRDQIGLSEADILDTRENVSKSLDEILAAVAS